jgi:phosphatidate cytidylyltransferase
MTLPTELWQRLLLLVWAILIAWSIPLLIITLIRKSRHKEVKPIWIKYGSWFIMVPVMTLPLLLGKYFTQGLFLVLSLYAFEEFSRTVGLWKETAHMWLGRICILLVYATVILSSFGTFMSMPAYIIILAFLLPILKDKYEGMIQRTVLTIFGVIYFGWFLAYLAYLANIETGFQLIIAFLLIIITNDASAYIIGSNLGRHKMVPHLSPNKTWEGAIGAGIITVGVTVAIRFALYNMDWWVAVILGVLLAFFGTCGDLSISLLKRDVHIKDTGHLIPGHGGLLDRLDSILFATPVFFHFMNAFFITTISLYGRWSIGQ